MIQKYCPVAHKPHKGQMCGGGCQSEYIAWACLHRGQDERKKGGAGLVKEGSNTVEKQWNSNEAMVK